MRKVLSNNGGYTMVLSLIIVVVFTVLTMSFFAQAQNTKVQTKVVEENYQAVALAEMGSMLYRNALWNEIKTIQNQANADFEAELEDDDDITEADITAAKNIAISNAYTSLSNKILSNSGTLYDLTKEDKNVTTGGHKYRISNMSISTLNAGTSVAVISYKTTGTSNGKSESVDSTIDVKFAQLLGASNPVPGETKNFFNPSDINTIFASKTDCPNTSDFTVDCKNTKTDYSSNSDKFDIKNKVNILFNGNVTFGNQFNNSTNDKSNLYINGNLTIKNANGFDNVNIFSTGTVTIEGNINNASSLKICARAIDAQKNTNNTTLVNLYATNSVKIGNSTYTSGTGTFGTSATYAVGINTFNNNCNGSITTTSTYTPPDLGDDLFNEQYQYGN